MLKSILVILAAALAILAGVIAMQPDEFEVSRSRIISAPPEAVFPHVNNLKNWQDWSPWAKLDPGAKSTFSGPEEGLGASMTWAGNKDVGEGSMTIIESQANEKVRFRLDFLKPFEGTSFAQFRLEAEEGKTRVTWSMSGKNNFIAKAVGLFMNCDKMVGGQFENGLESLAAVSETK